MLINGALSVVGIGSVAIRVRVGGSVSVKVALGARVGVGLGRSSTAVGTPAGKASHVASAVVIHSMAPAKVITTAQMKKRKPACPAARRCRQ